MRYWKGGYDEDASRAEPMCRRCGLLPESNEKELWVFRSLVATQVIMFSLLALLNVVWR
jgi:hypothetical protein